MNTKEMHRKNVTGIHPQVHWCGRLLELKTALFSRVDVVSSVSLRN